MLFKIKIERSVVYNLRSNFPVKDCITEVYKNIKEKNVENYNTACIIYVA